MTTAQQLGLVGNSVRVQALPTASAETFGQGNRYYTLIGQQEGYITGHTYHTVVANDVYSWEDVAQAGPQGEDGKNALILQTIEQSTLITGYGFTFSTGSFNRTPEINDTFVAFDRYNHYAMCRVTKVDNTNTTAYVGELVSTKGATGPAGTTKYNELGNIPVINQDLTASGFTPVANTYYRHIGATTGTFTQGIIYLYDTAYHKLGESGGGGTTLNRYIAHGNAILMSKIIFNAKSIISFINIASSVPLSIGIREDAPMQIYCGGSTSSGTTVSSASFRIVVSGTRENPTSASVDQNRIVDIKIDGTVSSSSYSLARNDFYIQYVNDVEITL